MLLERIFSPSLRLNITRNIHKRYVYRGTLNGPLVDFVPVSSDKRPTIFSGAGLTERFYRAKLLVRNIAGYAVQLYLSCRSLAYCNCSE